MIIIGIILVLVSTLFAAVGALLLKKSSAKFSFNIKRIIKNRYLLIGIIVYFASSLFFIPALKFGDLSLLYPFASLGYIWTALLSIRFLREKMNNFKWIAILLIIVGVSFIGFGS